MLLGLCPFRANERILSPGVLSLLGFFLFVFLFFFELLSVGVRKKRDCFIEKTFPSVPGYDI